MKGQLVEEGCAERTNGKSAWRVVQNSPLLESIGSRLLQSMALLSLCTHCYHNGKVYWTVERNDLLNLK